MTALAKRAAAFATSLTLERIPPEALEAAKLHLLDTLGCGLAAHGLGTGAGARGAVLEALGGGPGPASAIGCPDGVAPATAALVNGILCHALDFDDTHLRSMCHVGTVVGPAALAAAEARGADGRETLAAIVAGTELVARLGTAVAPAYMRSGFQPTSVCGVFGAAAAAARLRGLDEATTVRALGIAGGLASGTYEYLADGSNTEATQAGWAAHGGVLAAALAARGATGPPTVFEGRFGLLASFYGFDGAALEAELADLGERWETQRVAVKPYPAAHLVHSCLDAAAELRPELAGEEIEEVVVSVPEPGVPLVLEPRESKAAPRTDVEAKFSLPYSVAAMLVRGSVDAAAYTPDAIADPDVLAVALRVVHEPGDFATYPGSLPGRVRVRTRSGRTLAAEVAHERGGPERPLPRAEVCAKFRANAAAALAGPEVEALLDATLALETVADVGEVYSLLRRPPSRVTGSITTPYSDSAAARLR